MTISHSLRSRSDRTRREDRHLNFYALRDNLDAAPARNIATLDGRTIRDDATLADAHALLRHTGRRRLAVTTDESTLAGLLCLKASGQGFCSDEDVASRQGLVRADAARDSSVL
jgi:CBS-domain-containing membrane protein